jgi:hypothetical protein
MKSIRFELLCLLGVLMLFSAQVFADVNAEGWTVVKLSGEILENARVDSLCADSVFVLSGGQLSAIPLDSIGLLVHRPSGELSTRSYIIGFGCAALGVGIFLNNVPRQPDPSIWSGVIYGLEFGGAMLLGAFTGIGLGYVLDRLSVTAESIDLTTESRSTKHQAIERLLGRGG